MTTKNYIAVGSTGVVTVAPTCDTSAYATGELIGGKLTFTGAMREKYGTGVIHSVVIADKAKQNVALDIVLFDSDPSSTTFTDQATLTIADADLLKVVGVISVVATDYKSFADNSVADLKNIGLIVKSNSSSTSLYGCLVSRGTPTYASATDLQIKLKILQD